MKSEDQIPPESSVPPLAVLAGSHDIVISFADGRPAERLTLKALPLRQLPRYMALLEDEPALIELCTGKPADWVDSLTVESCEHLLAAAAALNFPAALRWGERRAADAARLAPLLQKVQPLGSAAAQRPSPSSAA